MFPENSTKLTLISDKVADINQLIELGTHLLLFSVHWCPLTDGLRTKSSAAGNRHG